MDKIKQKVLDEIIALMDDEEGNKLKKHPKLMAAKISVEKAEPKEMMSEMMPEGEGEESEDEDEGLELEGLDEEMLAKLAKLIK